MVLNSEVADRLHQFRSHVRRNWLTYASLLLIALVTFGVPQIRNLFAFPPLTRGTSTATVAFYVYAALLIGVYIAIGGWIVPPRNPLKKPSPDNPPAASLGPPVRQAGYHANPQAPVRGREAGR
jgi:hypothetical protein